MSKTHLRVPQPWPLLNHSRFFITGYAILGSSIFFGVGKTFAFTNNGRAS